MKHVTRKQLDAILESSEKGTKMSESMIDSMLSHVGVDSIETGDRAERVRKEVEDERKNPKKVRPLDPQTIEAVTKLIVTAAKLGKYTGNAKAKAQRIKAMHKAIKIFSGLFAGDADYDQIKAALRSFLVAAASGTPPKEVAGAVVDAYKKIKSGEYHNAPGEQKAA